MKTLHIDKPVNLVYSEVKRKLEDRKTSVFIVVTMINVFIWGLVLSAYNQTSKELKELEDKYEVTQIYLSQYKKRKQANE